MNSIKMIMNKAFYLWKRNNWMLNPKNYFANYIDVVVNGPIFLLGNQGDGLTLLSRMLRRNPAVVSVTGNSAYWAGADEMANVYELVLGRELSGIRIRAPRHEKFTPPRSWSYACDELIDEYRNTDEDASDEIAYRLRHVIGLAISRYGKNMETPRFVDKSQVYTVKMSFINGLLDGCNPYFIFVTRNPYASIYRAARGKAGDMKRYAKYMSLDERLKVCMEHWLNSAKCVEEDSGKVRNFMSLKFEELLESPQRVVRKICDFTGLEYSDDMMPQPHHKLPFGMKYRERWYPLRTDVNDQYLKNMPEEYVDLIHSHCARYIELQGYGRPNKRTKVLEGIK
ncbi:MAG TPA: sulfotransferase [Nitrospirae bacterium]|nr:sulfotransferase [Nitrospirota bacterium]